jgi:hypothetical protein
MEHYNAQHVHTFHSGTDHLHHYYYHPIVNAKIQILPLAAPN